MHHSPYPLSRSRTWKGQTRLYDAPERIHHDFDRVNIESNTVKHTQLTNIDVCNKYQDRANRPGPVNPRPRRRAPVSALVCVQ